MFRKLYDKTMDLSAKRSAKWVLAGVSFLESSVFPIPPDLFLIPLCLAERSRSLVYAAYCTVFSVLGGLLGYAIGALFYETLGTQILDFYGYREAFETFAANYAEWGFWIVFGAGLTPFPYKVITIASGVVWMNLPMFIVGSILSRGIRFFAVGALIYFFGERIRYTLEKYFNWVLSAFFILLLGGFIAILYL